MNEASIRHCTATDQSVPQLTFCLQYLRYTVGPHRSCQRARAIFDLVQLPTCGDTLDNPHSRWYAWYFPTPNGYRRIQTGEKSFWRLTVSRPLITGYAMGPKATSQQWTSDLVDVKSHDSSFEMFLSFEFWAVCIRFWAVSSKIVSAMVGRVLRYSLFAEFQFRCSSWFPFCSRIFQIATPHRS